MLSFLRINKFRSTNCADFGDTHAKRMDLEGRKAYRREMLYQSVRETLLSLDVTGSMYKLEVVPVDARHHRFFVLIDAAKSFLVGKAAQARSFAAMETLMRSNTYLRFGIVIVAVYWRVSESETQLERRARSTDSANSDGVQETSQARKPQDRVCADSNQAQTPTLARHAYQAVSADETKAFMDALRNGQAQPVVHVGDIEYRTDVAPLGCATS